MISYLIASYRPDALKGTLESIAALPSHNHEVVVCTPYPEPNRGNVRFVLDDRKCGSTYAFNKGASYCLGEWIVVGIDDHKVQYDVNDFIEKTSGEYMRSLEYQVINLGSPWTDCLDRNVRGHGVKINLSPEVAGFRWPVITFPAVSKKTIQTKFDGQIFNPNIQHHFVDHWIGLYVAVKQPGYNFNICGNHPAWTQHWPGENCDRTHDDSDSDIFCRLAARFIANPNAYGYTTPL